MILGWFLTDFWRICLYFPRHNALIAAWNPCWVSLRLFVHPLQRGGTCAAHGMHPKVAKIRCGYPPGLIFKTCFFSFWFLHAFWSQNGRKSHPKSDKWGISDTQMEQNLMFFSVFARLLCRTQLGNSDNKKGSHTNEKNSRNTDRHDNEPGTPGTPRTPRTPRTRSPLANGQKKKRGGVPPPGGIQLNPPPWPWEGTSVLD